jgi:hypothetical protein
MCALKNYSLLGSYAVLSGRFVRIFQRNLLPLTSGFIRFS